MSSKKDKLEVTALLGFALILISLGVDLCKDGNYNTGIALILVGLAVLIVYYVFAEKAYLKTFKFKMAGAIEP